MRTKRKGLDQLLTAANSYQAEIKQYNQTGRGKLSETMDALIKAVHDYCTFNTQTKSFSIALRTKDYGVQIHTFILYEGAFSQLIITPLLTTTSEF